MSIEPPAWTTFWGKTRVSDDGASISHLASFHCMDVAAVAQVLLQHQPPGRIDPLHWPLIVTLLSWHDIGKFSRPFQAKAPPFWPAALGPYDGGTSIYGHDTTGYAMLRTDPFKAVLDRLMPDWPLGWRLGLLRAVCGHHGRPPNDILMMPLARDVCDVCLEAALTFACSAADAIGAPSMPRPSKAQARRLIWQVAGLAVLADWIGSNKTWFEARSTAMPLNQYWFQHALPQARRAVAHAGVLPAQVRSFLRLTDLAPHAGVPTPLQAQAQTMGLPAAGPVLVVIEDQTGAGKTEAALLLSHRLMQSGHANGLFVALPTMATANAMYQRLAQAYRALFDEADGPSLVLAHGKRALHEAFQKSILSVERDDSPFAQDPADETAGAQCAAWVASDRRRAFLADVGVGTIDQALLAVLPSRHAPLRQWGLAQRVLIVDEAHAYDAYMTRELETLLAFHAGLGGSAIILSATLSQASRAQLVRAFQRGAGYPEADLCAVHYPLITLAGVEGVHECACDARIELARSVTVERLETTEHAVSRIVEAVQAGLAVAWVRNAVDDAIEAHAALRAAGIEADLFHARFAMGDRLDIETAAVQRFGRDASPTERAKRVLVATQVIEQSLDLDFDLMITDLAPIDLLIQRAGRLWRHVHRDRPNRWDCPRLLVISPVAGDDADATWLSGSLHRTRHIYRWSVLWRSARVLFQAGAIVAPGGIRSLVQQVYDDPEDVPAGLRAALNKEDGIHSAAISMASMNVLSWGDGYVNGGGWDSDVRTPTRLSEPSVTFRLGLWKNNELTPICANDDNRIAWSLSEISLAAWRAKDVPQANGLLRAAVADVKAGWGQWEQDIPLLVLQQSEAGLGGKIVGQDGEIRNAVYDSRYGLTVL